MTTEKKLKGGEFDCFTNFEKELRAFQLYFLYQGPQGPYRRVIMLEFCQRALNEAENTSLRKLLSDLDIQKTLTEDKINQMKEQINELKEEHRKDTENYGTQLKELENTKADLSAKEQNLRENLAALAKEKEEMENSSKASIDELKKQSDCAIKEVKKKWQNNKKQQKRWKFV